MKNLNTAETMVAWVSKSTRKINIVQAYIRKEMRNVGSVTMQKQGRCAGSEIETSKEIKLVKIEYSEAKRWRHQKRSFSNHVVFPFIVKCHGPDTVGMCFILSTYENLAIVGISDRTDSGFSSKMSRFFKKKIYEKKKNKSCDMKGK